MYKLILGDSRKELRSIPDNSVESVVTDPPYEISFMGAKWDSTGIAYDPEFWAECLRVLKPGGYLLSFGAPRTYHRIAVGIEDAGFEIRESLMWVFGSGFPKSHNISKAIDKTLGAERKVIGEKRSGIASSHTTFGDDNWKGIGQKTYEVTATGSKEAEQWEGWGTSLKPAYEPIIVARKPLSEKTVAKNVLKHGVGGLNIDDCRVPTSDEYVINRFTNGAKPWGNAVGEEYETVTETKGRWPANLILDEEVASDLDEQVGERKSGGKVKGHEPSRTGQNGIYGMWGRVENKPYSDSGGPSRFFMNIPIETEENNRLSYHGKVSKKERRGSTHTTMKPLALMRYLVRLVTPPDGTVLDPFTGSGTTGEAAILEGFNFIGIEQEEEHYNFSDERLKGALIELG